MSRKLSQHIRLSKIAVQANKAKGNRHFELLSLMYADPARCIEELIQNAEDAYRLQKFSNGKLLFTLHEHKLYVSHNGKPFDENDLIAITTIGKTTKQQFSDVNLIGKFGVGFKSVYSVCRKPVIHSGKYHFSIEDFEVLEPTEVFHIAGYNTTFVFPLIDEIAYSVILEGLNRLSFKSLLFLQAINEISVSNPTAQFVLKKQTVREFTKNCKHIEILNTGKDDEKTNFIIYTYPGKQKNQSVSFAFSILQNSTEKDFKYTKVEANQIFVSFPTEELSGLNFALDASFTTTPTREHIPFDSLKTPENIELLDVIQVAFIEMLHDFLKKKLLKPDFFQLLPLISDIKDNPVAQAVRKGIIKAVEQFSILPGADGKFYSQNEIAVSPFDELIKLISGKDLNRFFQKKSFLHPDCLTSQLSYQITEIEVLKKFKIIDEKDFTFFVSEHPEFLEAKPITWHKDFLRFIADKPYLWNTEKSSAYYNLRQKACILCQDKKVYPPWKNEKPAIHVFGSLQKSFPQTHRQFSVNPEIVSFFSMLGLPKISVDEETFLKILKKVSLLPPDSINQFSLWEKLLKMFIASPQEQKIRLSGCLSEFEFFPAVNQSGKFLSAKANILFFPFRYIIDFVNDLEQNSYFLSPKLVDFLLKQSLTNEEIQHFFQEAGVKCTLFCRSSVTTNINYVEQCIIDFSSEGIQPREKIIENYSIDYLDIAIQKMSLSRSLALAEFLQQNPLPKSYISFSSFSKTKQYPLLPDFIEMLSSSKWLVDSEGNICNPNEIVSRIPHKMYREKGIDIYKVFINADIIIEANSRNTLTHSALQFLRGIEKPNLNRVESQLPQDFSEIEFLPKPLVLQIHNIQTTEYIQSEALPDKPLTQVNMSSIIGQRKIDSSEVEYFIQLPENIFAKGIIRKILTDKYLKENGFEIKCDSEIADFEVMKEQNCQTLVYVSGIKTDYGKFIFRNFQTLTQQDEDIQVLLYAVDIQDGSGALVYEYTFTSENGGKISSPFSFLTI